MPSDPAAPEHEHESGFPINRLVAILSPWVSVAAGAIATWLLVHVHFLGLFHVGHSSLASAIANLGVFALVALLTHLSSMKWLTGWQVWEGTLLNQALGLGEDNAALGVPASVPPAAGFSRGGKMFTGSEDVPRAGARLEPITGPESRVTPDRPESEGPPA